jgi:hypothetical protein
MLRWYNPYMGQTIANYSLKRSFIGHFKATAAENSAADDDGILDGKALTSAVQTVTTFLAQPSCAKNLTVTGKAENMAGNVVITGKNIMDETITETFALNGTSAVVGSKAFKTVTSISIPVLTTAGDTVDIGWGVKLGMPIKLLQNTVIKALRDTSTADSGTVAVSATAYEDNTYTAGAQTKTLDVWFIIE